MTKQQRKDAIADLGCIVCLNMGMGKTPAQLHHPYGHKGENDDIVLPLCYSHHQQGSKNNLFVSRHPWKKEFERRYGTEQELLEQVNAMLAIAK